MTYLKDNDLRIEPSNRYRRKFKLLKKEITAIVESFAVIDDILIL